MLKMMVWIIWSSLFTSDFSVTRYKLFFSTNITEQYFFYRSTYLCIVFLIWPKHYFVLHRSWLISFLYLYCVQSIWMLFLETVIHYFIFFSLFQRDRTFISIKSFFNDWVSICTLRKKCDSFNGYYEMNLSKRHK